MPSLLTNTAKKLLLFFVKFFQRFIKMGFVSRPDTHPKEIFFSGGGRIPMPKGAIMLMNVMRHIDQLCREGHVSGKEHYEMQNAYFKLHQEFQEEATLPSGPTAGSS